MTRGMKFLYHLILFASCTIVTYDNSEPFFATKLADMVFGDLIEFGIAFSICGILGAFTWKCFIDLGDK